MTEIDSSTGQKRPVSLSVRDKYGALTLLAIVLIALWGAANQVTTGQARVEAQLQTKFEAFDKLFEAFDKRFERLEKRQDFRDERQDMRDMRQDQRGQAARGSENE